MPEKALAYAQLAQETAKQITGSYREWTAFLTTAARLYKYPYHEQLLIYAQRPDATACAEYDVWNKTMRRYVRRGSKGIALLDPTAKGVTIRYVFDASDTGGGVNARTPFLWALKPEHEARVIETLESAYGVADDSGLADALRHVSMQLADEYWLNHQRDILGIVDGSFLEGYDDANVGIAFHNAAAVSVFYTVLSRCGYEPADYLDHEDFLSVFDFNTPDAVAVLGTAVSEMSEDVLRQIEMTVKNIERSYENERTDLSSKRGLPDSELNTTRNGYAAPGQVREDAEDISQGTPTNTVQFPAPIREIVNLSTK